MYLTRTLCDVLEEMRTCCTTLNFSYLNSLIEEAQTMGNRMEAALEEYGDVDDLKEDIQRLKKERKKLRKEVVALKEEELDEGEEE